mgnify:CR=1 FL=1
MNVMGIGNYSVIYSSHPKRTNIEETEVSTSFADMVQNKLDGADKARGVDEAYSQSCTGKPVWHWHDGPFGYSAEVYKNEGSTSEYTVKLKYDNGKEEERIVDAEKVNASSCDMVDLSVRMYHLEAEGKIENSAPDLIVAHLYLQHRTPNANENTIVDYRSWFEQQLDLELNNDRNWKNICRWTNLLDYL